MVHTIIFVPFSTVNRCGIKKYPEKISSTFGEIFHHPGPPPRSWKKSGPKPGVKGAFSPIIRRHTPSKNPSSPTPESGHGTSPDCHFGRVISGIVCKKQYILPHFFKIRRFLAIDANRGVLVPIEKTSTDAFGGCFSVKMGGSRCRSKRTPVLAPCFRGP